MKKIETLIQARNWDAARAAIEALHTACTLREVRTFGRTPPRREVYRGTAYQIDVTSELELAMFVRDEQLSSALAALASVNDGSEIAVSNVELVIGRDELSQARPVAALRAVSLDLPLPAFAGANA